jgi:phosphoenolpyruvate carboxykinase (GTP)
MWPGFGDNMRVIEWIIRRSKGEVGVNDTAIGGVPDASDININGLSADEATLKTLLEVDRDAWKVEMEQIREYLEGFGDRLPAGITTELDKVAAALKDAG